MSNLKTKAEVLREYPEKKRLINAVISRVGIESVGDVFRHGIDGGFPGFTYYADTVPFAHRYRKEIIAMLKEQADDLGEDVVKMVSGFGVYRNNPMDEDERTDLYRYLGGCKCRERFIPNLMAWYAAEEICRLFEK